MYRTGFINQDNNTYIRMKQGLPPQVISGDCQQPSYSIYYPINLNSKQVCNYDNMHPVIMRIYKL